MKNIIFILALLFFLPIASCASTPNSALKLPSGANEEANKHNEEGISHYNKGHYDIALKQEKENNCSGKVGDVKSSN